MMPRRPLRKQGGWIARPGPRGRFSGVKRPTERDPVPIQTPKLLEQASEITGAWTERPQLAVELRHVRALMEQLVLAWGQLAGEARHIRELLEQVVPVWAELAEATLAEPGPGPVDQARAEALERAKRERVLLHETEVHGMACNAVRRHFGRYPVHQALQDVYLTEVARVRPDTLFMCRNMGMGGMHQLQQALLEHEVISDPDEWPVDGLRR